LSEAASNGVRTTTSYDLVVIGSGPGGQRAAIAAAKLGKRVALVERDPDLGGVWLHRGTVPSKALRESVLYLSGFNQREIYGQSHRLGEVTIADLVARTAKVRREEADVVRDQLRRNRVSVHHGSAAFEDSHTLVVQAPGVDELLTADRIVVATGTRPARPPAIEFDGRTIVDSDQLLEIDEVPASMVVVGAGVIGVEYASMFAALGVCMNRLNRLDSARRSVDDITPVVAPAPAG